MTYETIETKLTEIIREKNADRMKYESKKITHRVSSWDSMIDRLTGQVEGLNIAKDLIAEARGGAGLFEGQANG